MRDRGPGYAFGGAPKSRVREVLYRRIFGRWTHSLLWSVFSTHQLSGTWLDASVSRGNEREMDFYGGEFRMREFEKFSQADEWGVLATFRFGVLLCRSVLGRFVHALIWRLESVSAFISFW